MPPPQSDQKTNPPEQPTPLRPVVPVRPATGRSRRAIWLMVAGWLVLIAAVAGIVLKHQQLHDYWQLRGYHPPAAIKQLADQDTMTDYARHMFYLNHPQIVPSVKSFRDNCPDSREVVVLGCYHPNQAGIYIYDVKDSDLQGVAQVTAAHEDLHAIYERLSDKDRNHVNGLLQDYYDHGLRSQRVKDEIKLYQKTEPHDVLNEMHSIFGTEIADLPAPLETYYKQYFTDRAAVVAYEQHYEQAFSARQQTVAADDRRLAAMKSQIDSQQAQLNAQLAQVKAAKANLDGLLAAGQDTAYNNQVDGYNAQVSAYNSAVASLKAYIKAYNDLVSTRNAVADQLNALNRAQDTRVQPQAAPAATAN